VQAREVGGAAFADPRAERTLIETAKTETVNTLQQECRRVRAAVLPDELARNERIRCSRRLRHWSDPDGAFRLDARLTPNTGAIVVAAIQARQERIFTQARATGLRESSEAYAADALVELAREGGSSGPRAMVHVVVDQQILASGRTRADRRCEIRGIGPIPAATARALAEDAIIKKIAMNGSDVVSVEHRGRTIPARVRTALEVRDPVCVVPECDVRRGLEIDHYRIAYADGGPTRLDNLARLCGWHHHQKTHLGYRLSGGPGAWKWETPNDIEARPPPHP